MAITLRPATFEDIPTLELWDRDPHVIASTTDDPDQGAFGGHYWRDELSMQSEIYEYLIAELDGRPIGGLQIIDPHREPTHYWGEIEPDLRAIDIWIGSPEDRGHGYGEVMMKLALERCFSDPRVTAIVIDPLRSNIRAHRFYQRLGFKPIGQQFFGEDDCLVHRLERSEWDVRIRALPTEEAP